MKEHFLRVMILGAFLWLAAVGSASAQQNSPAVPKFKNDAEKAAWIQANPAEYSRLIGNPSGPAPDFKSQAEKDAWLQRLDPPKDASSRIGLDLPGYPRFVDTGNPDLDNARYAAAKEEWIAKNPAKYESATTVREEFMSREERLKKYNGKE